MKDSGFMALVPGNSRSMSSVGGNKSAAVDHPILPEDLLIEVLSRLPVKALIRFKSVCRRWYDLFSNPNFISTHLRNSRTNRVRCDDNDVNYCGLKVVAFEVLDDQYPDSINDFLQLNLNVDFDMEETPIAVVGYCDGIFCLSSRPITSGLLRGGEPKPPPFIVLHNPAVRETRVLPHSNSFYPPHQWISSYNVGFGFDQKTKDYIVVKMVTFMRKLEDDLGSTETDTIVEIYSLSTDSWRVIDKMVKDLDTNASSSMVISNFQNGILYWSFFHGFSQDELVVPFHIDDENLLLHFDLPKNHYSFNPKPFTFLHLSVWNRNLAFLRSYIVHRIVDGHVDGHTWVEIWVMKSNGGVGNQWSLEFTVESFPGLCKILGFWNTNVLMMYDYFGFRPILYDIVTKQTMDLQLCGELDFFYKESLVSVKRRNSM